MREILQCPILFSDRFNFRMSAPSATEKAPTQEVLPSASVLQHASRLAIHQDKPILLDYYVDTASGKAFMGEDKETKEKMLVKSNDEFTSIIQKVYKVTEDYIIITENSIYIVSGKIQKRRIQAASMRDAIEELEAQI